jgi:ribonuclease HI
MVQLSLFGHISPEKPETHWTIFIDGASRNNPGVAGAGVYILHDGKEIHKQGFFLGTKTNNEAEYLALLLGLYLVHDMMTVGDQVRIVSDSLLVVCQVKGEYRVKKAELKPLHALATQMMKSCGAHIMHVLRADNEEADGMANQGIDKKLPIPPRFTELLEKHGILL